MNKKTVQKEEKVGFAEKSGFLLFSTSTNIIFNFKSLYYLTFLKMILKIPVFWASTILTIGTVWDAINDPLIGYWSVNHTFKNGEKIRPLALIFAFPWAITIVLMFADFGLSERASIIICILIYIVFEAFYTFLCIPYNSMGALASNRDDDRRSINAFRSLGSCIGSGIGAVAVPVLVKNVFGGLKSDIYTEDDARALLYTALVMAVICLFGCFAHYFTTKERVKQVSTSEEHIGFWETFKMLFSIKSWTSNLMFILCYGIITAIIMAEINDYAAYVLGDSSKATPIMAVYLVAAVAISVGINAVDNKLGRKGTMIFSAVVQVVGKLPFMLFPFAPITIYINAFTTGIGATAAFIMFNTNRNNIADIVEFKFGRRIDSMVSTCDNLISKLAEALAVWVMGIALATGGYNADLGVNQPTGAISTICALLGWVPCIFSVIMTIYAAKTNIAEEYKQEKERFEK